MRTVVLLVLPCLMLMFPWTCLGFPQGAPTEACETLSPMRGHGESIASPENSPFAVFQSRVNYGVGETVSVNIVSRDPNAFFRGFLIQGQYPDSGRFHGRFRDGPGLTLMPECSAVSHKDARPKQAAQLEWVPEPGTSGSVVFRSTIVQNKTMYYENLPSFTIY